MQTNTITKKVELNKDDVDWFYTTYYDANLSAVLSMLLTKLRQSTEHSPDYYADLAIKSLKEELG